MWSVHIYKWHVFSQLLYCDNCLSVGSVHSPCRHHSWCAILLMFTIFTIFAPLQCKFSRPPHLSHFTPPNWHSYHLSSLLAHFSATSPPFFFRYGICQQASWVLWQRAFHCPWLSPPILPICRVPLQIRMIWLFVLSHFWVLAIPAILWVSNVLAWCSSSLGQWACAWNYRRLCGVAEQVLQQLAESLPSWQSAFDIGGTFWCTRWCPHWERAIRSGQQWYGEWHRCLCVWACHAWLLEYDDIQGQIGLAGVTHSDPCTSVCFL